MMTADRPYTDADVEWMAELLWDLDRPGPLFATWRELAAGGLRAADVYRERARAVLDALTAAGWRNLRHVIGYRIPGDMLLAPEDVVIVTGQSITHTTPPERGEQDD